MAQPPFPAGDVEILWCARGGKIPVSYRRLIGLGAGSRAELEFIGDARIPNG